MSVFTGSEGEAIDLTQAAEWTANYRNQNEAIADAVKAHFFGHEILQRILGQEGCVGIRMYYALDDKNQQQLILVGVNADGQDMEDGTVADRSRICPPDCGIESSLLG